VDQKSKPVNESWIAEGSQYIEKALTYKALKG
jgi:hypothetical protein